MSAQNLSAPLPSLAVRNFYSGIGLTVGVHGRLIGVLFLLCSALLGASAIAAPKTGSANPNIVFILADDLGHGDVACQNPRSKIRTPNLDRLASQGMRFVDAHAPSALCTPTRYGILTGQYCWRSRLKFGVLNMWDEPLIPEERLTVAGMLRNSGYRTACFGKWHLGLAWPFMGPVRDGFDTTVLPLGIDWTKRIAGGPVDRGFDYYFGVNIPNQPPYAFIENDHVVGTPNTQFGTVTGLQGHWAGPGVAQWDWTQLLPSITSNAVTWLQNSAAASPARPFFLYLPLPGPHQPVVPNSDFLGKSQAGLYGDYVEEMDWAVGRILDSLEQSGVATNTLVIFTSDNGPDEFAYSRLHDFDHSSMGDLRGIKNDIWEGGHRVPFLARWPGRIAAQSINQQTICLVDFMRTAADIVGTSLPSNAAEDSVSFLPALLGQTSNGPLRQSLILESGCGQFGIRSNNWMYIDSPTGDGHNPELEPLWFKMNRGYPTVTNLVSALLYDLYLDSSQKTNLLPTRSADAAQLKAQLDQGRSMVKWTGLTSQRWNNSTNWTPCRSPSGLDVVYTNCGAHLHSPEILGANFSINSLALDPSINSNLTIASGGSFTLTLSNGIDMSPANADLTISAPVVVAQSQVWEVSPNHILTLNGGVALRDCRLTICGGGNVCISNSITGSGKFNARSTGFILLSGPNSYAGGTEISGGGFLVAQNDRALGLGEISLPNNSTLLLEPNVTLTNRAHIAGNGACFQGRPFGTIAVCSAGTATYSGPVNLSADATLSAEKASSVLTFHGPISGDAGIRILALTGTVVFAAQNLYTGGTCLEGKLRLSGGENRLPAGTSLLLGNSPLAELDLNGCNQTVASLAGGGAHGGRVRLNGGTLTVAQNGAEASTYEGAVEGSGAFEKTGTGILVLAGTNTHTGPTTVHAGQLRVEGSLGQTALTVLGEGVLSGTGLIGGSVSVEGSGLLRLGGGKRPLTIRGALKLSEQSKTLIEVDATTGACDGIQGIGHVTYGGTLVVHNRSGTLLTGETFRVFSTSHGKGHFSAILPAPGPGLAWSFNTPNGILTVVAQPSLHIEVSGNRTLTISWPGSPFHLQAQTNSMRIGLSSNWFDYAGGGTSPVTLTADPGDECLFFRLVSP